VPEESRHESVRRFKRELIRDAAKQVFAANGIEGASVREIAKTAGYTTGAIYTYFASKEELYAEVLRDSLDALLAEVRGASEADPEHRSAAALRALWSFYDTRRADFELGFYLYGGARPAGLTRELDRDLNARLDRVVDVIGEGLVVDGVAPPERAHRAAVGHATWIFGLLLMSTTGRIRSLGEDAEQQLTDHLETLTKGIA
jgi:AcrR family transcriptional regulator